MMRLRKVCSKLNKPIVNSFKLSDLETISALLKTNLSLKDSFMIAKNKHNKDIFKLIIERLDNGELIESIFKDYLKDDIKKYFLAFIKYLSFNQSLNLALEISNEEKDFKIRIFKEISYPLFLLAFTVGGIYIFNQYCFDALFNSMNQFGSDINSLYVFKTILDIGINVSLVMMLVLLFGLLFFTRKKRLVMAYILLEKYWPHSMIKEYLSSRFVIYFRACYKVGLKTKETMEILKNIKDQPLISFIAFHIDEAFLKGNSIDDALKNPYIDDKLSSFVRIAMYTSEVEKMLEAYFINFKKRFSKYCQNMSKFIQLTSYLLIGVIVIFIYQILFIPMGIIGGL